VVPDAQGARPRVPVTETDYTALPHARLVPRCTCGPLSLQPCRVCLDPPEPNAPPEPTETA
jgi:hypothetical protein